MDLNQYDEFGRYIGPELEDSDSQGSSDGEKETKEEEREDAAGSKRTKEVSRARCRLRFAPSPHRRTTLIPSLPLPVGQRRAS